jgi:Protein of unknown function (DUF4065)
MSTKTNIEYNEKRMVELILYIGAKCGLDEHYDVLKLNKILFFSDFQAFRTRGKPITGAEYAKLPNGPAPRGMKRLRKALEARGEAFEYKNPLATFNEDGQQMIEKRLLPMRKPEIDSVLDPEEIAIVDQVIERLRHLTGTQVSDLSHLQRGWLLAAMDEPIPYSTALLPEEGRTQLSVADFRRAKKIADEYSAAA